MTKKFPATNSTWPMYREVFEIGAFESCTGADVNNANLGQLEWTVR